MQSFNISYASSAGDRIDVRVVPYANQSQARILPATVELRTEAVRNAIVLLEDPSDYGKLDDPDRFDDVTRLDGYEKLVFYPVAETTCEAAGINAFVAVLTSGMVEDGRDDLKEHEGIGLCDRTCHRGTQVVTRC